jgi:hypothetical protein
MHLSGTVCPIYGVNEYFSNRRHIDPQGREDLCDAFPIAALIGKGELQQISPRAWDAK